MAHVAPPGRPPRAAVGQACRKQNCPPRGLFAPVESNCFSPSRAPLPTLSVTKDETNLRPTCQLYRLLPHPGLGTGHRDTCRPRYPGPRSRQATLGTGQATQSWARGTPLPGGGPPPLLCPLSAAPSLPSPPSSLCRTHRQAPATPGTWWPSASWSPRTNPLAPIPSTPLKLTRLRGP